MPPISSLSRIKSIFPVDNRNNIVLLTVLVTSYITPKQIVINYVVNFNNVDFCSYRLCSNIWYGVSTSKALVGLKIFLWAYRLAVMILPETPQRIPLYCACQNVYGSLYWKRSTCVCSTNYTIGMLNFVWLLCLQKRIVSSNFQFLNK